MKTKIFIILLISFLISFPVWAKTSITITYTIPGFSIGTNYVYYKYHNYDVHCSPHYYHYNPYRNYQNQDNYYRQQSQIIKYNNHYKQQRQITKYDNHYRQPKNINKKYYRNKR